MKPRVSVIVPSWNRATLIGETLECLLRQSLPPHQLIVVDNGSVDDTVAVVRGFGNRVQLVTLPENIGPGAARNVGLARATGEFVQFFDSDDLATHDKLELQAGALAASGADIAYSPWAQAWFDDGRVRMGPHVFQQHAVPRAPLSAFLRGWVLFMPASLVRRSMVERVGGYPSAIWTGEDLELLLRMILAGARFVHVPGPVLLVRQHPHAQVSAAPELADRRAREAVQLIDTIERLIAEAGARYGPVDRLCWHARAAQSRRELALRAGAPVAHDPIAAATLFLRRLTAGMRARRGKARLGPLFSAGRIAAPQTEAIRALGYEPLAE